MIPYSNSEFKNNPFFTDFNNNRDSNLNIPDSPTIPTMNEGNVAEGNAADTEISLGIKSAVNKVDGDNGSSSINKKKLVEDKDFTTQSSKGFKQDSRGITADTEPYNIIGGEDN